jgi:putative Holliday junction resolvase
MAIDPGDRWVGLAVSDELGITAQGLETFDRKAGVDLLAFLSALIDEYDVAEVVVGHPVSMSGRPSVSSRKAQRLARDIGARFGVKVTLWDERLSSEQAKRVLRGSRAGKPSIDRVAAVLILQSYLDSLPNTRGGADG